MSLARTTTALAGAAVWLHAHAATALAARSSEDLPLDLGDEPVVTRAQAPGTGGGGLARTLVGLAVVIAVIWGLSWVLRQVKASREERASGRGLSSLATLPLGPNRSLHVVRAGHEVLLVGVSEHQVTPLRVYDEQQAEAMGLLAEDDDARPAAAAGGVAHGLIDTLRQWTVRR